MKGYNYAIGRSAGQNILTSRVGCAYSPDGRFILSVSWDQTLKVWDISTLLDASAQTGRCLVTLAVEGSLHNCAWSPDGTGVVAVGYWGVYFFKAVV